MKPERRAGRIPGKDRRDELVQIAYQKIAERGFEGLRVRDVAEAAGINNATLHYYFPTKEDLIQGMVDYLIGNFAIPRGASEEPAGGNALNAIRNEFADGRRRLYENPDQFIVFTELLIRSKRDPRIAQVFARLDESWRQQLTAVIASGIRTHEFRLDLDPDIIATTLMAQVKGIGFQMLGERDLARADAVFAEMLHQVESWLTRQDEPDAS